MGRAYKRKQVGATYNDGKKDGNWFGGRRGECNYNNNCIGESNGHGNSDRDEERARATAKGNGTLTAMATATATKRAY
jgi:hypothetical protein